jgi:hypothetical protein
MARITRAANGLQAAGTSIAAPATSHTTGNLLVLTITRSVHSDGITNGSPSYNLTPFNATGDATNYFADGYRIVSASEAAVATCTSAGWMINAAAFQELR